MLTLQQFTDILPSIETLAFICNGQTIAQHFHITEIGYVQKSYIDCGGNKRHEQYVSMQLWIAGDTDHRLSPVKLHKIIDMGADLIPDIAIPLVFEYQGITIGSYHVDRDGTSFILEPIYTNSLAQDKCGIAPHQLPTKNTCCGNGCC